MAKANLSSDNIISDGGVLYNAAYSSTATIISKVVDNHAARREKTTFHCHSTEDGTWIIYDVDEDGEQVQVISIPVTANVLSIYSHNHIALRMVSDFTPAASPGTLKIRAYTAGYGARS